MSIKTRLERIENSIDPNVCQTCGQQRAPQAAFNLAADGERALARYAQFCNGDREKALACLREDDPEMVAAWERAQSVG